MLHETLADLGSASFVLAQAPCETIETEASRVVMRDRAVTDSKKCLFCVCHLHAFTPVIQGQTKHRCMFETTSSNKCEASTEKVMPMCRGASLAFTKDAAIPGVVVLDRRLAPPTSRMIERQKRQPFSHGLRISSAAKEGDQCQSCASSQRCSARAFCLVDASMWCRLLCSWGNSHAV